MTAAEPWTFDPTDPDVNWAAVPHDQFRALRGTSPVAWVEQQPGSYDGFAPASGSGYWALTRHAEVAAVSKDSKHFSSAENGAIIRFPAGMTRDMIEMQRVMILNQDPPEHTAMRHIHAPPRPPSEVRAGLRDAIDVGLEWAGATRLGSVDAPKEEPALTAILSYWEKLLQPPAGEHCMDLPDVADVEQRRAAALAVLEHLDRPVLLDDRASTSTLVVDRPVRIAPREHELVLTKQSRRQGRLDRVPSAASPRSSSN